MRNIVRSSIVVALLFTLILPFSLNQDIPKVSASPLPPITSLGSLPVKFDIAATNIDELDPAAAYCGHDTSLAVYTKDGNIYGQYVGKDGDVGNPFRINAWESPGNTDQPDVACDQFDDRYIVVWRHFSGGPSDEYDLLAQSVYALYHGDGVANLYGFTAYVAAQATLQQNPAISCNSEDGMCLVAYETYMSDTNRTTGGDVNGKFLYINDSDPNKLKYDLASFIITNEAGAQHKPDVAWNGADDKFLVTWQQWRTIPEPPDSFGIYYSVLYDVVHSPQTFTAATALTDDTTYANNETEPSVAYDPILGDFLIVFTYASSDQDVLGHFVSGDGTSLPGSMLTFANVANEYNPSVSWSGGPEQPSSGAGANEFLVAYIRHSSGSSYQLIGQKVPGNTSTTTGSPETQLFKLPAVGGYVLSLPAVTGNFDNGRWFVAFQSTKPYDSFNKDICGIFMAPYYYFKPLIRKP